MAKLCHWPWERSPARLRLDGNSSYVERTETAPDAPGKTDTLLYNSAFLPLFETLALLLQPNGTFLRRYKEAYSGKRADPESPRHAAGACLIRLMYEKDARRESKTIDIRDLRTIEWLCKQSLEHTYDFAVVSRLFLHLRHTDRIPLRVRLKVRLKLRKLLPELILQIQSAKGANIAGQSTMRHESLNQ